MNRGGRPYRSKLVPYLDEIRGMRKNGSTYSEIAEALNRDHGLGTHRSTVHDFVKVRAKGFRRIYALPEDYGAKPQEAETDQKASDKEAPLSSMRMIVKARQDEAEQQAR